MSPYPPEYSHVLFVLGDVALLVTALTVVTFTAFYMARSDWKSNPAGKALAYTMLSFSAVLALTAVSRLLGPDYLGRELLRLGVYIGTSVAMIRLFVTLVRIQHTQRQGDRERNHHSSIWPLTDDEDERATR